MKKSKPEPKVSIRLVGLDKEFSLGKVAEVKLSDKGRQFIYLEQMNDGKWRLCYTDKTIPDIKKLEAMKIVRESDEEEKTTIQELLGVPEGKTG